MSNRPDNAYELTPMTWKPARSRLVRPYTTCIMQMMEEDIEAGRLVPGIKLPPQRELASWLGVDIDTISKAYSLCREKGFLQTFRNRGSFITLPRKKEDEEARIERDEKEEEKRQEAAGAAFLKDCGLSSAEAEDTLVTEGTQSALAACLSALFHPGDAIACDTYTDSGFLRLAALLHLTVLPVESDEEGMKPSSLAFLCQEKKVKGIYLNPDVNNPTGQRISKTRRSVLTKVIKKHGLLLLEDGSYSPLCTEQELPMSVSIPDQAIYLSGFASAVGPGLLTSYAAVPKAYLEKVETASRSLGRHCLPLLPEIAEKLILSGTSQMITGSSRSSTRAPTACTSGIAFRSAWMAESWSSTF